MLLKVARQDDKWLVSDLEIRKRKSDDHPGSVLRQARAMNAVTDFLAAYQEDNQERLQKLTEEKFFKNELSFINQIVDCSELTFERITFIDNTVYFHFRNLSPRPVSILTK